MKSLKRSKTRKVFFGVFLALAMVVGAGTSLAQKLPLTVEAASGEYVIDFWNPSKLNDGANSTLINKAYVNGKSSKTLSDVTNISTVYQERKGGIGFGSSKSPAGSFTLSLPTTVSKAHVYATNWTGTETPTLSVGGAASQTVSLSHGTLEENTVIDDLTPYEFDFSATNSVKFSSASKRLVILQIVLDPAPPLVVSTIEVQQEADKMDYYVGETFDKTGLEVKANYVGGTSGLVDNDAITVTPSLMALGVTSVELDYLGVKTTLSGITVESVPTVNSLSLSGTANKTEYYVGEAFDYDGLTVTAHLSNGKTENVTALATYTPTELAVSDVEVTITYGGKSVKYGPIVVKVQTVKEVTITSSVLGLNGTASERNHTLEEINFTSKVRDQQGAILFDKGAGYIYNTTSLINITKIELNYASGSTGAVQYFNFGDNVIAGHKSSGDITVNTSPVNGKYTAIPSSSAGFFNLSVSSANHLQLTSLVVHYTLETLDVEGITITKPTVSMLNSETTTLGVTFTPSDATNTNVSWESSDATKVSITGSGPEVTLTALAATGENPVTITATSEDGGFTATSLVTVSYAPVSGVALNKENIAVNVGASEELIATVSPSTALSEVTWTSSDATVATVEAGVVTGVKAGNATITATSVQDPTKSATADVEVSVGPTIIFDSVFGEGGESEWVVKSGQFESYFGYPYGGKGALTLESIKLPNHPVNTEYKVTIIATSVSSPGNEVTVYGVNAAGDNIAGVTKSANMRYGNYSGNLANAKTDAYSHPTVIELPLSAVEKLDRLKIDFGSSPSFLLFEINVEVVIAPDTSYEDAKVFADWMMDADRNEEECGEKFIEAALMWEELSYDARSAFQEHVDFIDAHERFLNWAIANGFNSLAELDAWLASSPVVTSTKAPLTTAVIISLFSLTTLMGYYFISKKRKFN